MTLAVTSEFWLPLMWTVSVDNMAFLYFLQAFEVFNHQVSI